MGGSQSSASVGIGAKSTAKEVRFNVSFPKSISLTNYCERLSKHLELESI